MGRPPRIHYPGAIFHVLSRGNERRTIYTSSDEYKRFLELLADLKASKRFRLFAYCLMPNHFHLLLQVGDVSVSQVMQQLLTSYANSFNSWHGRSGHLFQSRFKAIHCVTQPYFLELLRYIHLNPVRAGLVSDAKLWPWSGHVEIMGDPGLDLVDADYALSQFHPAPSIARIMYAEFLAAGKMNGDQPIPNLIEGRAPSCDESPPQRRSITLEEIAAPILASSGLDLELIRSLDSRAHVAQIRRQIVSTALLNGFRPFELAEFLNRSRSAISMIVQRSGRREP
jgi:putative transposase